VARLVGVFTKAVYGRGRVCGDREGLARFICSFSALIGPAKVWHFVILITMKFVLIVNNPLHTHVVSLFYPTSKYLLFGTYVQGYEQSQNN
jgi:hypothetical protein